MTPTRRILNSAVIIGALGYFVDIFDLVLFGIVRVPSFKAIGIPEQEWLSAGLHLLNLQMAGMLIGGLFWGILGDKRGRVSVLFGSIFLYSLANIANAFVSSLHAYGILRLIAGIGLAGELGAAITLVSEVMSKEHRGYGTMLVAGIGGLGALAASQIGEHFGWQTAYLTGGFLGLCLLLMRVRMLESGLFSTLKENARVRRGDFLMLLRSKNRFFRYLNCILVGIPIWYMLGILIFMSPEFAKALGVLGPIVASRAIFHCYFGFAIGDVFAGVLSQWMKSRKKATLFLILLTAGLVIFYLESQGLSPLAFYTVCWLLGFSTGYWAMFVTIAAEQFGTNLRATVTTTVPNFVRGAAVPVNMTFVSIRPHLGLVNSALLIGLVCFALAVSAVLCLKETFGKDLNYLEI